MSRSRQLLTGIALLAGTALLGPGVAQAAPAKKKAKPRADLVVRGATTTHEITVGNRVYYTVVVENKGPKTAKNVVVTATLPVGAADFNLSSPGRGGGECGQDPETRPVRVVCKGGSLKLGASLVMTLQLDPDAAGSFSVVVKATSAAKDPHPANNTVALPLVVHAGPASADLGITLSAQPNETTVPGGYTERVTIHNAGPSEAVDVTASFLFPPRAHAVTAPDALLAPPADPFAFSGCSPFFLFTVTSSPLPVSSTKTLCFDLIPAGETRTETFHVLPSIRSTPMVETDAVVSARTPDPALADNRASSLTAVAPFQPPAGVDLVLTLDPPSSAIAGKPVAVPFRLHDVGLANAGPVSFQVAATGYAGEIQFIGEVPEDGYFECPISQSPLGCLSWKPIRSDESTSGAVILSNPSTGPVSLTLTATAIDGTTTKATVSFDVTPSRARR